MKYAFSVLTPNPRPYKPSTLQTLNPVNPQPLLLTATVQLCCVNWPCLIPLHTTPSSQHRPLPATQDCWITMSHLYIGGQVIHMHRVSSQMCHTVYQYTCAIPCTLTPRASRHTNSNTHVFLLPIYSTPASHHICVTHKHQVDARAAQWQLSTCQSYCISAASSLCHHPTHAMWQQWPSHASWKATASPSLVTPSTPSHTAPSHIHSTVHPIQLPLAILVRPFTKKDTWCYSAVDT